MKKNTINKEIKKIYVTKQNKLVKVSKISTQSNTQKILNLYRFATIL